MKLADYLKSENVRATHLAARLGVSVSTVTRIAGGNRGPSLKLMRRIAEATNNQVRPDDFLTSSCEQPIQAAE